MEAMSAQTPVYMQSVIQRADVSLNQGTNRAKKLAPDTQAKLIRPRDHSKGKSSNGLSKKFPKSKGESNTPTLRSDPLNWET